MGWQDAPAVSSSQPAWASAPAISAPTPAQAPTLMQKVQASAPGRFVQGLIDPMEGGLQALFHAGAALHQTGDNEDWNSDVKEIDSGVQNQEKGYQAARAATGNNGLDLARVSGNVLSPINFALPELAEASKAGLIGRAAAAATNGAAVGGLQPVTDSSTPYGSQKTEQVVTGALAGAALPAAGAVLKATGKVLPAVLGGITTGAGSASIRGAYNAGLAGGDAADAFTGSMRGTTPWSQVVTDAKGALANMRAQRGADYRSGMADISKDASVLDFAPVDAAIAKTNSVKNFKGQDLSPNTADVRNQVTDAINNWKALPPADFHTPEGFDALKQQLGDIRDAQPFNTPQRVVADNAYGAVRGAIATQAPAYNNVMGDYSKASDLIDGLQRELSLGPKGNPNTALRKLQSVMRDNVNTSWGDRTKYANTLSDAGATTLLPSLAGQAMSSVIPRGLARYADVAGAAAGRLTNPLTLAALPLASPRLVGESAYALGSGVRNVGNAAAAVRNAVSSAALPRINSSAAALGLAPVSQAVQQAIGTAIRKPGLFGSGPLAALLTNPAINGAH